jgi:uncharacterized RDD family membrane protein YckC
MQGVMNAFAQTSTGALSGSKLDNRRVLAALIDLAIVGAGGAAILVAAGVLGGDGGSLGAPLAGVVVGWALYYYFACESGGGQTVGKKVTRLRVVREDGSPAGMREIAIRTVLRVVDTALVGLVAMMATGERRARLGDLAAGTMVVSSDGAPSAAPADDAPVAVEAPAVDDELEPDDEEFTEVEDGELARGYEPITGVNAAELDENAADLDEPVVDESVSAAPATAWVVKDEAADLTVVESQPRIEIVSDEPVAESPPADEHKLDVATPSLNELAQDVAAATESEPAAEPVVELAPEPVVEVAPEQVVEVAPEPVVEVAPEQVVQVAPEPVVELAPEPVVEVAPEPVVEVAPEPVVEAAPEPRPRPLAEVEIGGPEVDVDEAQVTVRSVDTVSAIDLVMGADDPAEDRPAADAPPAGA